MWKRILLHTGTILLLTVLQTTWLSRFSVTPGLLLVFALLASLFKGPAVGGVYGLVCGMLTDTFSGGPEFLNTLLFLYACILMGVVSGRVISRNRANGILLVLIFSAVYFCVYYFFSLFIWGNGYSFIRFLITFFWYQFFGGVFAGIFYNTIRRSFLLD